jgi:hypothetical protein
MGLGNFTTGLLALAAICAFTRDVARRVRLAILPRWTGAPAHLATAVIGLGSLTSLLQLLGSVGEFRLVALIAALAALDGLVAVCVRRWSPRLQGQSPDPMMQPHTPLARVVGIAGTGSVIGAWLSWFWEVFRHGVHDIDSIQYHLPFAARFVQTAYITSAHYVRPSPAPAFFPANGELLHGVGMLAFERDVLTPLINFGWLALLLLAAWCCGRPRGVAPFTMLGAALVAALPVMGFWHAGTGLTDVAALALLLSCVALLLNGDNSPAPVALAGIAAGLGLGTKLTIAPAIVAITIAVVVMRSTRRRPVITAWFGSVLVPASYWLVRNLLEAGNPLPAYRLGFGRFALASYEDAEFGPTGFSVLHYVTDRRFWIDFAVPGLWDAFGIAWPVVLALTAAGIVFGWRTGDSRVRLAAAVALAAALAYPATPYTAAGQQGKPTLFSYDLRYLTPGLVVGLVALALAARSPRVQQWLIAILGLTLLVTLLSGGRFSGEALPRRVLAVGLGALGAITLTWLLGSPRTAARLSPVLRTGMVGVVAVVVLIGGWSYQRAFLNTRYHPLPAPLTPASAWLATVDHVRIGIGGFTEQYPLYGPILHNEVQFIGVEQAHGGFRQAESCHEWWAAIAAGRYDYVVVANKAVHPPDLAMDAWTRADPRSQVVLQTDTVDAFRVDATASGHDPSPAAC